MSLLALTWIVICFSSVSASEYYSYDGRGNNRNHPTWGAANTPFARKQVQTIGYSDGKGSMGGVTRPSPREITMKLQPHAERSQIANSRHLTDMVTYLGQFLDHEFDKTVGSEAEPESIPVPRCDFNWDRACHGDETMAFYRSRYIEDTDGVRQQINSVTSYLDGSVVYGSSKETAMKLRTLVKGRMATSGDMLPDNILDLPMAGTARNCQLKAAGDTRANVHPPMLALQTLFVREHNRIAAKLHLENPFWSDEHIFQEARKLNVAYMQSICFNEYLPMLGIALDPYQGYDQEIDASIDNFFATVSYRYGHSEVNEMLLRIDEDGKEIASGHLLLSQSYFSPKDTLNSGIEPILRGLCMKMQAEVDVTFASAIINYLFGVPKHGGIDLISFDVQRGRDHGIPDYNTARIELGLPEVHSFEEITSDLFTRRVLRDLYGNVNNIDAYVGGMAEDHVSKTSLGSLFYTSMKEQYQRIRDGDRLYYENTENGLFTDDEVSEIKATGLRDIILRNTDIEYLPDNIFVVENESNPWPKGSVTTDQSSSGDENNPTTKETTLKLNEDYTVKYWLEDEDVHFIVRGATEGWMAIGIEGAAGGMIDADIVICRVQNGQGEVLDTWSTTFAEPGLDEASGGTSDVTLHAFSEQDGFTEVHFSRLLDTGDALDNVINKDAPTAIIFAWGTTDTFSYHGISSRVRNTIEVTSAAVSTDSDSTPSSSSGTPTDDGELVFAQSTLGAFTLLWATSGDELTVKLRTEKDIWVGIGLEPEDGGMTNADMYLGFNDGEMRVIDGWSSGYGQPSEDDAAGGTASFIDSGASAEGGVFEYWFTRKLDTGDDKDKVIKDETIDLVYAWGSSSTLGYHGPSQRALASVNFASSEGVASVLDLSRTMIRSHGGIMVSAWAALGLTGCGIARFGRGWTYWLKAHRLVQISTTVLALIGEVIGFSYTKGSFRTAHSITALCVVFVTFPQVSLGAAAMKKSSNVHYSKLHKGTGYFIIGLALWQIWTGLVTLEIGTKLRQVFLGWTAAWFIAFHFSTMKATNRETEALIKQATLSGEHKKKKSRPSSQAKESKSDADEEKSDTERLRSKSRRSSMMMAQLEKSGQGSEMIELLIKTGSSDDSDGDSDESSMGATAWSESVGGGAFVDDGKMTSDSFYAVLPPAVQEGNQLTVINDIVYDLTSFVQEHPGGSEVLEDIVGVDGTESYLDAHGDDRAVFKELTRLTVAELNDDDESATASTTKNDGAFLQSSDSHTLAVVKTGGENAPDSASPKKTTTPRASEMGLSRREWRSFSVESVKFVSNDVLYLRVQISGDTAIDFPLTSHLMVRGTDPAEQKRVSRCFTPLIPDQSLYFNKIDLLVKCYENGRMSRYMRTLTAGDYLELKGPLSGFRLEKGKWQKLGLIGGGSGITPLWQVITGLLEDPEDTTQISLVYQNRFETDILLKKELDALADRHSDRFSVVYVLSKPPEGWSGLSGRVNADLLSRCLACPGESPTAFVMICGPPGLNDSVAGAVDKETTKRVGGILQQIGYTLDMLHAFNTVHSHKS